MKATRLQIGMLVGFMGVAAAVVIADGSQGPRQAAKNTPEITELLKERLVVLQELADSARAAFQAGALSPDELLTAESDLLLGRLDLAEDPPERVKIREEHVEIAMRGEKVAQQMAESANASHADVLRARAFRLQAQIDLVREQQAHK